ncbi:hypothetical protein ACHWQZ_G013295 [Mnemiopsis leidyi]
MRIASVPSLCSIFLIITCVFFGRARTSDSVETFQFKENLSLEPVTPDKEQTCLSSSKIGVPDKKQLTREVKYTAEVEREEENFLVATSVVSDNPEFQFEEDNSSGQCYKTGDSKDGVCTVTW